MAVHFQVLEELKASMTPGNLETEVFRRHRFLAHESVMELVEFELNCRWHRLRVVYLRMKILMCRVAVIVMMTR